jgi:asparagine synthase (glutamine-hydrolysing)
MKVGFVATSDTRNVVFRLARPMPGGGSARLVSFSRSSRCAVALLGRLHYRDALTRDDVGKAPPAEDDGGDAAIAMWAYEQRGWRGLAGLEGDFSVAVWDGDRQCFLARRDPLGAYPLFCLRRGTTVALATGVGALLPMLSSSALNPDYFAGFLMGTGLAGARDYEACAYDGVQRLANDAIWRIDIASGRQSREPCWNWRHHVVDCGSESLEELAREFGRLLRAAVSERISGRTAAHLSGGMDSTSICLLALDVLNAAGGRPELHALSLVYRRLSHLAQETPFIDDILDGSRQGLIGHRVNGDEILHFDILANPPPHDEPCSGLWAMGQDQALIGKAAAMGVDTLLTGEGADDLLHATPNHLADLVARGRFLAAWKDARGWARARGSNPWSILRQHGLGSPLAPGRLSLLGRIFHLRAAAEINHDWTVPPWIDEAFARRHELESRSIENRARIYRLGESRAFSFALHGLERRTDEPERAILAAPHGISLTHPFLDPRVLGFALVIHGRFQQPVRQRKPVLAEAMRGVLREAIRTRPRTGNFNEVLYSGLSHNLDRLKRLITRAPDELGMLRKDVLIAAVEEAALGVSMPSRLRRLNEALSLVTWLSMRSVWENRPLGPADEVTIPVSRDGGSVSSP